MIEPGSGCVKQYGSDIGFRFLLNNESIPLRFWGYFNGNVYSLCSIIIAIWHIQPNIVTTIFHVTSLNGHNVHYKFVIIINIYRLLHGWWVRTIFMHELWRIANERVSVANKWVCHPSQRVHNKNRTNEPTMK